MCCIDMSNINFFFFQFNFCKSIIMIWLLRPLWSFWFLRLITWRLLWNNSVRQILDSFWSLKLVPYPLCKFIDFFGKRKHNNPNLRPNKHNLIKSHQCFWVRKVLKEKHAKENKEDSEFYEQIAKSSSPVFKNSWAHGYEYKQLGCKMNRNG